MPNGWEPQPFAAPYRVMIVGAGRDRFFDATDAERRDVFLPRFTQMIAEWEELGARVVASFVDDVFQVGETDDPFWAFYLIFEVDTIDVAAQLIQASRQSVDGVRMDAWVKLSLRVGRPFFAREEKVPHHLVDPQSTAYAP